MALVWCLDFNSIRPFWKLFGFYLECIEDTLFPLIVHVYAIEMYDMQTLHTWGHPHVPGNISSLFQ